MLDKILDDYKCRISRLESALRKIEHMSNSNNCMQGNGSHTLSQINQIASTALEKD